jgi:hypothetical protein
LSSEHLTTAVAEQTAFAWRLCRVHLMDDLTSINKEKRSKTKLL